MRLRNILILSLIMLFIGLNCPPHLHPAIAAETNNSQLTVTQQNALAGSFFLRGRVPSSTAWVWIEIKKNDLAEDIFVCRPEGGLINKEILCRFGPGKYQIYIYHTASSQQFATNYYPLAKLSFVSKAQSQGYSLVATTNSAFILDVPLYPEEKKLHFQISEPTGSKPEAIFLLDKTTAQGTRIHLPFGNVTHQIKIWGIDDHDQDVTYNEFKVYNGDTRNLAWLLPSVEVQSDNTRITALAQEITLRAKNDREKIIAIHAWVAKNITYNILSIQDGSYRNNPQDALTTLRTRTAVCTGYANLTAALLRASGIKCKVVSGIAGKEAPLDFSLDYTSPENVPLIEKYSHAWNKVFLDGQWQNIDTTWDAGYVKQNVYFKCFSSNYLLKDEAAFRRDHLYLRDEPF